MSYCDCSDYESSDFDEVHRVRRARKQHRCCECGGPIKAGEAYDRTAGKWSGDFYSFATCIECSEMRRWAQISVPCFCAAYGGLHEKVRAMVSDVRKDIPGFLFEWGRRAVKIKQRGGQP